MVLPPRPSFCGTPNTVVLVSCCCWLCPCMIPYADPVCVVRCYSSHQVWLIPENLSKGLAVVLASAPQQDNAVWEYSGSCVLWCIVSCVTMELLPVYSVCHVPAVCLSVLSCPLVGLLVLMSLAIFMISCESAELSWNRMKNRMCWPSDFSCPVYLSGCCSARSMLALHAHLCTVC